MSSRCFYSSKIEGQIYYTYIEIYNLMAYSAECHVQVYYSSLISMTDLSIKLKMTSY